jgi:hypothetical protein
MVYKQIKINITREQLKKALNNKPISIKNEQIGAGSNYLSLHPANVKIVEKSKLKGRGCVLNLAPGELMATAEDMKGAGFFGDIYKGLKSGYDFVKKNVIDTDIYQKVVKPLVKTAVDTGATALSTMAPGLAPAINIAKDTIGRETGAFGMKRKTKAQKKAMLQASGLYLS